MSALSVHVVDDWRELEALRPAWEDLALHALEPSAAAEAWMLIPALRHALPGAAPRVVLVYADDPSSAATGGQLCGVFSVEFEARHRGLRTRVIRSWNHLYAVSSAPLLRRDRASACVNAFLDWAAGERPKHTLLHFPELNVESEFFGVLSEALRDRDLPTLTVDVWSRAMFRPDADADRYLQSVGTSHHRHEWRRQERRLGESGALTYDGLAAGEPVAPWIEEFVALEMAGWKGRNGSAFGCTESHRAWLDEVLREAHARRRAMLLALRLDGRAIAMKINVLAPPGAYAFKIAFDESLLKYSPGVLLELENIRRLHANPAIRWMDSLATANHSLMNRVWPGRTAVADLLIAPGPASGKILLSAIPLLRSVKRLVPGRRRTAAPVGK